MDRINSTICLPIIEEKLVNTTVRFISELRWSWELIYSPVFEGYQSTIIPSQRGDRAILPYWLGPMCLLNRGKQMLPEYPALPEDSGEGRSFLDPRKVRRRESWREADREEGAWRRSLQTSLFLKGYFIFFLTFLGNEMELGNKKYLFNEILQKSGSWGGGGERIRKSVEGNY